jgi:hypothetical protein
LDELEYDFDFDRSEDIEYDEEDEEESSREEYDVMQNQKLFRSVKKKKKINRKK